MQGRGLTPERILGLAGTAGLLIVLVVILAMLSGGGGDDEREAGGDVVAAPTQEPKPEPTATPKPEPTVPPLTREQRQERDAAVATMRERGYAAEDLETFRGDHTLRVLFGEPLDGPEGTRRAFFFVGSQNVGTDAPDASGDVKVSKAEETEIRLRYRLYQPTDDADRPSGELVRVRFRWDGASLVPLDPVPSAVERRPPGTA